MPRITEYPSLDPMADDDLFVVHNQASGATRSVERVAALRSLPADSVDTDAVEDDAITPVKRSGGFAIGTIAGTTLNSTGNKAITGVGFRPKLVRFAITPGDNASNSTMGFGAYSGSSQYYTAIGNNSRISGNDACIAMASASSTTPFMRASGVSLDADGFTINVSTAGNISVAYEAYA